MRALTEGRCPRYLGSRTETFGFCKLGQFGKIPINR
jgi:hypothetical protein